MTGESIHVAVDVDPSELRDPRITPAMAHLLECFGRWCVDLTTETMRKQRISFDPPQLVADAVNSLERETNARIRAAVLAERAACAAIADVHASRYGEFSDVHAIAGNTISVKIQARPAP